MTNLQLDKKKREDSKKTNEREITTDSTEKQSIIRDYSEQLHGKKIGRLRTNSKFLETYNLPTLNHEEIENLNRYVTSKDIETVIKNLPTNKSPGLDAFTHESCKAYKEDLIPIFLKLFQ